MVSTLSQKRLNDLNCVLGLDCSKYQVDINWAKAKACGIQFAFVKITEGTTGHEDNLYNLKARVLSAQKNGVKVGYYHFARPGNVDDPELDAKEEIDNVLSHIGFLPKANLPLVLDIESYSDSIIWTDAEKSDHMNRFVSTFLNELAMRGMMTIFYSYKSFIDTNTTPAFGTYPLWLAAYLNNPEVSLPALPNGWNDWKIWQFTEKGLIDGYVGDIDLNIMKTSFFNQF